MNIRLTAKRTNRAVMDACAAIGAALLKNLAANSAEPAANGIG